MIDVISPDSQTPDGLVGRVVVQTTSRRGKRLPYLHSDSYRVAAIRGHSLVVVPTTGSKHKDSIPYKTVAMACDTEGELQQLHQTVHSTTLTTEQKFRQLLRLAGLPVDAEDEINARTRKRRKRRKA